MNEKELRSLTSDIVDALNETSTLEDYTIDFSEYAVEDVLKNYLGDYMEGTRYTKLIEFIEERHDLGQDVSGRDVLHWIQYG